MMLGPKNIDDNSQIQDDSTRIFKSFLFQSNIAASSSLDLSLPL